MKYTLLSAAALILCLFACSSHGAQDQSQEQSTDSASLSVSQTETQAPRKKNTNGRPLTFAFTGDIMMGTTYPESGHYLPANDGADIFRDVTELLSGVDLACGNLEGTMVEGHTGSAKKCGNCYSFRMPPRYVKHLVNAGYDFVGIANNHINDFGPAGVKSTQETLKENGILFAGLRASCPVAYKEVDGRKIGFAAFGHNNGTLSINDMDEVKRTVKKLDDECDIVVVSFHGGGEGTGFSHVPHKTETCFGENRGNVEAFAHAAVDAGADIVYGHGPHVTRALELYKDHLIVYSLGNFCTPYRISLDGIKGYAPVVMATLNPDGTFKDGKINSFIQQKGVGPRKDSTNKVAQHMRSLTQSDFPNTPLHIGDDGTLSKK